MLLRMSGLRTAACAGRGFRGVAACAFLGTIVLASFAAGGSAGVVAARLVFSTDRSDGLHRPVVDSVSENGGGTRRLGVLAARLAGYTPLVRSPRGNRILLVGPGATLDIASPSGAGLRRLSSGLYLASPPSFSPDGKWITFNADSCTRGVCTVGSHVVRGNGSGRRQLATDSTGLQWAPDSKSLTGEQGGLSVVRVDGTGLRLLTTRAAPEPPAFSPDGQLIAYFSRDGHLDVIGADGSGRRSVLMAVSYAAVSAPNTLGLLWSPNGKWLALEHRGGLTIFGLNGETTGLSEEVGATYPVAWSPDSRNIAYLDYPPPTAPSSGCRPTPALHSVALDSANLRTLAPDSVFGDVRWANHRLSYIAEAPCDTLHVAIANADGSDVKLLTRGTVDDTEPSLSPDGTKIAYLHGDALWIMNADGSDAHALWTHSPVEQLPLARSPDGRLIAYVTSDYGAQATYADAPLATGFGTYTVAVEGGNGTPGNELFGLRWSPNSCSVYYTDIPSRSAHAFTGSTPVICDDQRPSFGSLPFTDTLDAAPSPDGKNVVFYGCNRKPESPAYASCAVYTAGIDGHGLEQISPTRVVDTSEWTQCFDAGYSPDGVWIAYGTCEHGQLTVTIEHPDGTRVATALAGLAPGSHPDWMPDSTRITGEAIDQRVAGQPISEIRSYNLATGATTTLVNGPFENAEPHWASG